MPQLTFTDQLAEIEREAEEKKAQLTPEVRAYLEKHLKIVTDTLAKGKLVRASEMRFLEAVKDWIDLPEKYRKKYPDMEIMLVSDEMREAKKRQIGLDQWLDLLYVAEAKFKNKDWIAQTFQFLGQRKISCKELNLTGCSSIRSLPEELWVEGSLDLCHCTSLTSLSLGLQVGRYLYLSRNLSQQVKEDAARLKREGKIKGEIIYQ